MQYEYPPITGYRWNLVQKLSIAFNIPESQIYTMDNGENTIIGFNGVDLTEAQKTILDGIVASNPCLPPTNTAGSTFRIKDIWSMRQWFIQQIGITPKFWFEEGSNDGSGVCYMYVQFDRPLTLSEKKKIKDVYAAMIEELVV